ncbi:uncharacterized protein LOC144292196 isoform X2 [Canis aureus]
MTQAHMSSGFQPGLPMGSHPLGIRKGKEDENVSVSEMTASMETWWVKLSKFMHMVNTRSSLPNVEVIFITTLMKKVRFRSVGSLCPRSHCWTTGKAPSPTQKSDLKVNAFRRRQQRMELLWRLYWIQYTLLREGETYA